VPTRLQNLFESICLFIREDVARPVLQENTDKYIGFLWTIFYFILTMNLLSMIPTDKIIYFISGTPNHWGGSATANIWITGGLAMTVFFSTHFIGIREQGLRHYLIGLAPPTPGWLLPLIYPLEIISHLVRPFTLALRLFANILAGHMVLATVLGLILIFQSYLAAVASVLGAVALSFLELLVAFIQAYIFTFLSTLYIGGAVSPEH
jgi:F-type H+-transporting ATPase subunit a